MSQKRNPPTSLPQLLLLVMTLSMLAALLIPAGAGANSTDNRLEAEKGKLERAEEREGVLTTTLADYSERIAGLEDELATLHGRESVAAAELAENQQELAGAQAELGQAQQRLASARAHLKRALIALRQRVVAIYESGSPDFLSVLLSSRNYSDLAASSEYLAAIQTHDEAIVGRVQGLRNEATRTVARLRSVEAQIKTARDAIAAREEELTRARAAAEGRRSSLLAVRADQRQALSHIKLEADHFNANIEALQQKIAEEITAASSSALLPVGPPAGGASAQGLIWPVQGVITSGFGPRWGSFHPGLDIGAAEGTPIYAAASGTVILMQSEAESGGYGNYTCIDHGGGLSTCYAHQTSFATSLGAIVSQGELIGYVGSTGFSTGPHLHFEVRIDGEPHDPLEYL